MINDNSSHEKLVQSSCAVCNHNRAHLYVVPCGHVLHGGCSRFWPISACPVCRQAAGGIQMMEEHGKCGKDVASIRHGRWTIEEEQYADALIEEFNAGRLLLRRQTKLVDFLKVILCRTPAGINRKFPGCRASTYGGYRAPQVVNGDLDVGLSRQHAKKHQHLQELEGIYLIAARQCQVASSLDGGEMPKALTREWQLLLVDFCVEVGQSVVGSFMWSRIQSCSIKKKIPCTVSQEPLTDQILYPPLNCSYQLETISVPLPGFDNENNAYASLFSKETNNINESSNSELCSVSTSPVKLQPPFSSIPPDLPALSLLTTSKRIDNASNNLNIDIPTLNTKKVRLDTVDLEYQYQGVNAPHSNWAECQIMNEDIFNDIYDDEDENSMLLNHEDKLSQDMGEHSESFWRQQRTVPNGSRRLAFDDSLFDQMCGLIYNYKSLKVLNSAFDEESVIPLLLQVMSACSQDTAMWIIDLKHDHLILAVTDGVSALELHPKDLIGRSLNSVRSLRTMYHPHDTASFRNLRLKCQQHVQKVVQEAEYMGMAVSPFHSNVQLWLKNVQRMRFRCNPLNNGWADMVDAGKAPEEGYDCVKIERIFSTDRFLLISDRVVMRGKSSTAPFGPPMASFFTPAWPPTPRMLLHSTFATPPVSGNMQYTRPHKDRLFSMQTYQCSNVANNSVSNVTANMPIIFDHQNENFIEDETAVWNCLLEMLEEEGNHAPNEENLGMEVGYRPHFNDCKSNVHVCTRSE